ncbi:MAG: flagellar biosynthetic protein FliQ [Myxococcales bacterium]|nr:flagellar biosynthetic protein FliQ [Myxococcales bacterium]
MTSALVGLARDGALLALALLAPVVLATLLAGALTAIVGAVTQVRDPALGFAPRLVAVVVAIALTAPVIAGRVEAFTTRALAAIVVVGQGST